MHLQRFGEVSNCWVLRPLRIKSQSSAEGRFFSSCEHTTCSLQLLRGDFGAPRRKNSSYKDGCYAGNHAKKKSLTQAGMRYLGLFECRCNFKSSTHGRLHAFMLPQQQPPEIVNSLEVQLSPYMRIFLNSISCGSPWLDS